MRDKVAKIREAMSNDPALIVAGRLPPPAAQLAESLPGRPFVDLLFGLFDGGSMGVVDLWSIDSLPEKQYVSTDFEGGSSWIVIGQITYDPIAIDEDGMVHLFRRDGRPAGECLGSLRALIEQIFSERYLDLTDGDEDDDWLMLLRRLKLA